MQTLYLLPFVKPFGHNRLCIFRIAASHTKNCCDICITDLQYSGIYHSSYRVSEPAGTGRNVDKAKQTPYHLHYINVLFCGIYLSIQSVYQHRYVDNYITYITVTLSKIFTKEARLCLSFLMQHLALNTPVFFSSVSQSFQYSSVAPKNSSFYKQAAHLSEPPVYFCGIVI